MLQIMVIIKFFIQGVPETAAVLFSCFALAGHKINFKILLIWAVGFTLVIYTLRMSPLPWGIHSTVTMLVLSILIHKIANKSLSASFVTALTVSFILAIIELIMSKTIKNLLDYQFTLLPVDGELLWIFSGLPQVIMMFIFGYCVYRFKFRCVSCQSKGVTHGE